MQTRAAQLKAPWQVRLETVDLPEMPSPGWARIRVTACGVCGSDLNAAASNETYQPIGHEIAGVIEQINPQGPTKLEAGQSVVLESSSFCGRCDLCRDGRVDLCNKAPGFWGKPAMGFADFMDAPLDCIVPYAGLEPEVACLAEPVGVAIDMVKTANIQLAQRVCLIGPGPIGLAAGALALRSGASELAVLGRPRSRARLDVARKIGAEVIASDQPLEQMTDLQGRFDHVLLTAPTELIRPGLELLAYGGILTYIGFGRNGSEITFDADRFHMRKWQLRASFASPAVYFPAALSMLYSQAVPGRDLVSHVLGLDEIDQALQLHRERKGDVVKIVVKP
ncbi:MAG: zinc-dependent alcohol dehydrogenase [Phycisphaerae bacterium]